MQQSSLLSLPKFNAIDISAIETELDRILTENRATIAQLIELDDVNWANFSQPIQQMDMQLEDFFSPISHLNAVQNSDELREVYQACIAKLTAYGTELGQNAALQQQYQKLQASDEFAAYSAAQKQWIKKTLLDFHLSGVDLPAADQQRFKTIKNRLAELSQTYSNNVLDATAAWKRPAVAAELKGLPVAALSMLQQQAQASDVECEYLLSLDFPVYQAVITYADDRALREEIYQAYMCKASEMGPNAGEFDNSDLMVEILNLRQELAEILSFANYGERSLATKMANSVAEVSGFLETLAKQAKPFAEKELATLQAWASENIGIDVIESWDFAYTSEKYRQAFYALNDEALREYFPLDKVLSGLFEIVSRLFNIQIELVHFARDVKISRNEADIAIAVEKPKSTSTIIAKLCDYQLQLYGHASYLKGIEGEISVDELSKYQWVSYVDNLLFTEQLSYLKELNAEIKPSFQSTSITSQYSAIKSGLGIGILPCFLAEQDASLVKLCANEIKLVRSFYLVTHPESKRLSQVETVWQYLKDLAQQKRQLLMPE